MNHTTRLSDSRRRLVEDNLALVHQQASRCFHQMGGRVELDELIALGSQGLIEAALRFDSTASASFRTFAYYRVRGAMLDGVGKIAPMPRSVYRRERKGLEVELTAKSSIEEDRQAYASSDPEAEAYSLEMGALLERALEGLPADKQRLLRACYFGGETLLDAGRDIGISKSWACRMHANALRDLRAELEEMGVDGL